MEPRWKHECSDCSLIASTKECDIYKCTDDRVTFRYGEGKNGAVYVLKAEWDAATKALASTRLLEVSKKLTNGFLRNGDMIVSFDTVAEFQKAILEDESKLKE